MVNKPVSGVNEVANPDDDTTVQSSDNRPTPTEEVPEPGFISGLIGFRGLGIFNGFLNEEWLNELRTWQQEVRAYLEMRDDITISTLLSAIKLPLQGAEFHAVAADPDNPADVEAAEFLEENLHGMKQQTWRAYIEQAIEVIDFGWAVNEIVIDKADDGMFRLVNLDPRGQETLRRWGVKTDEPDIVTHMVQGPFRTGNPIGQIALPLWKCIHLTWQGRKGNPQGKSLLRSLYMGYKFLKNFRVFEGIGIERDAAGIPKYTLPPGAGTLSDNQRQDLEDQLKGLKIDEQMFVVIPPGSDLELMSGGAKAYDIRKTIEAYEKAMLMRGFAQFLALGTSNVGTQSLVEGQSDFFGMSLRAFQMVITEQLNQQLVPYLFQFNRFEGMSELPKLVWDPPTATDVAAGVQVYSNAVNAGLLTPIRADEETTRGLLNLAELPDDVGHGPRGPASVGAGPDPDDPFALPELDPMGGGDLQDQALNGAQVSSLVQVVQAVADGNLPAVAAKAILSTAFPTLSEEDVNNIVDDAVAFDPTGGGGDPENGSGFRV